MGNIDPEMVELQKKVVDKFNKNKYPFYSVQTNFGLPPWIEHGYAMTHFMQQNKVLSNPHDLVLFLDIDCIPLSEKAIDYFIEQAYAGKLIGNIQRSNHIENNQHVYAAPSALAVSKETYEKLGEPTFIPIQNRGDTAEELTYVAEESKIPIEMVMPLKYDAPPMRQTWETDKRPYWVLRDGMPNFGIGTTFGDDKHGEMYWHCFQSYNPDHQLRFKNKCKEVLNG
jgi:hypothetical protein